MNYKNRNILRIFWVILQVTVSLLNHSFICWYIGWIEASIGQVEEEHRRGHCSRGTGTREERLSAASNLPARHCQETLVG